VATGYGHSCALIQDGTIWCWGNNTDGELGNGATLSASDTVSNVPVKVLGVSQAVSIATGAYHTCAVLSTGIVQCWGNNFDGELGNGKSGANARSSVPVNVKIDGINDLTNGLTVVAGTKNTCVLLLDHSVKCWGDNGYHQLGSGATSASTVPVTVVTNSSTPPSPLSQVSTLALNKDHTCAIQTDGTVFCWGDNGYGQLGNQSTASTTVAVKAIGIQATAIGVGDTHSCAIVSTGAVQCWGSNSNGELGDNTTIDSITPVTAQTSATASVIALGKSHSCAVLNNATGKIECWGLNDYGQLGNGTADDSHVPFEVLSLSQAKSTSGGEDFTCAIISGGSVYCWGDNWFGQLGDGTGQHGIQSSTPVLVLGF
jgi:alpha-tubulin suppressor-like RCC1 family protein